MLPTNTLYLGNNFGEKRLHVAFFVASSEADPTIAHVMGRVSDAHSGRAWARAEEFMRPRQFVTLAALCGTVALAAWGTAFAVLDNTTIAIKDEDATNGGAISLTLEADEFDAPLTTTVVSPRETATSDPDPAEPAFGSVSAAEVPVVEAPVLESRRTLAPETPVRLISLFPSKAVNEAPLPPVRQVEIPNECPVLDACVDDYLWSLYERTPKVDTNRVTERIKKTVKKKGKTRTVVTTITKYMVGDFTWKDPIAAQRAGMSTKDYVIGGMDRSFKLKLYHALRAMDDAGLMPGITSAFRDDYRQAIATGNKAASDSSYHGGSRRGGFGHGLAVDLVSVKGNTRMERWASTEALWKWIDAHEKELAIGRPYQDRDPPHVGPLDGKEYAAKRARANVQKAGLQAKKAQTARLETKKHGPINRNDPDITKRARPEKSSSKVSSLQSRVIAQP